MRKPQCSRRRGMNKGKSLRASACRRGGGLGTPPIGSRPARKLALSCTVSDSPCRVRTTHNSVRLEGAAASRVRAARPARPAELALFSRCPMAGELAPNSVPADSRLRIRVRQIGFVLHSRSQRQGFRQRDKRSWLLPRARAGSWAAWGIRRGPPVGEDLCFAGHDQPSETGPSMNSIQLPNYHTVATIGLQMKSGQSAISSVYLARTAVQWYTLCLKGHIGSLMRIQPHLWLVALHARRFTLPSIRLPSGRPVLQYRSLVWRFLCLLEWRTTHAIQSFKSVAS